MRLRFTANAFRLVLLIRKILPWKRSYSMLGTIHILCIAYVTHTQARTDCCGIEFKTLIGTPKGEKARKADGECDSNSGSKSENENENEIG